MQIARCYYVNYSTLSSCKFMTKIIFLPNCRFIHTPTNRDTDSNDKVMLCTIAFRANRKIGS